LNSVKIQYVYIFSLGVALVLTLPVILYPITEMLEAAANNNTESGNNDNETTQGGAVT
jgi:hypothetical protein